MAEATNRDSSSKRTAGERLQEALLELNRDQAADGAAPALTAKALCELAGVSRNALYRYHPAVLHELHKLQRQRHREPSPAKQDLQRLRTDNENLCHQATKLAALVDQLHLHTGGHRHSSAPSALGSLVRRPYYNS